MYDYRTAIYEDVKNQLREDYDLNTLYELREEELANIITEQYWTYDNITGNGSGSYTFSTYTAGTYLAGNLELAVEALEEMGYEYLELENLDEEYLDVTIRCYLLIYESWNIAKEIKAEVEEELDNRPPWEVDEIKDFEHKERRTRWLS